MCSVAGLPQVRAGWRRRSAGASVFHVRHRNALLLRRVLCLAADASRAGVTFGVRECGLPLVVASLVFALCGPCT